MIVLEAAELSKHFRARHGILGGRGAQARGGAARSGRPARAFGGPVPARVLGRPAPAHRHRAGTGVVAQARRARRAGLRARRVDPGPDPQPAAGPADPTWFVLSV